MKHKDGYIEFHGDLETDGSIVYINGMDLANVLRASVPHRDNPRNAYQSEYGCVTLRIWGQKL